MTTMYKNLAARFKTEWINGPLTLPHYLTFGQAFELADKISAKRNDLVAKGTLSAKGLDEAVREFVTKDVVPELARARCKLEASAEAVTAKRQALTFPKPDKSDLAGAVLRQELRAYLRGLPQGERYGLLLRDPDADIIAAVFEAPDYLSGIDAKLRAELENRIVAAAHPQKLQAIEDERECINLANIAINHAVDTIRKATGYDHSPAFDQFMAKASAPIESEFAKKGTPPARTVEDMVAVYRAMPKADQNAFLDKWFDGELSEKPAEQQAA